MNLNLISKIYIYVHLSQNQKLYRTVIPWESISEKNQIETCLHSTIYRYCILKKGNFFSSLIRNIACSLIWNKKIKQLFFVIELSSDTGGWVIELWTFIKHVIYWFRPQSHRHIPEMIKNRHSFVSRNIISGNAITPQNRMKLQIS